MGVEIWPDGVLVVGNGLVTLRFHRVTDGKTSATGRFRPGAGAEEVAWSDDTGGRPPSTGMSTTTPASRINGDVTS
jgi:hypothetical protein